MPSTKELNHQYVAKDIALDLIDDPQLPERETMDDADLGELALNIKEVGLIKPLIVKPVGDRFEVVAGHRRVMACRIVQYTPVPCRVIVRGKVDPLAILVSENGHTESVNPVEEARFYRRLLDERCGNDVDALCIAVKRRREYVEDRLLILMGDERVVEALHQRKISLAVARELNKVPDPNRRISFLDVAIHQGASARTVMEWRRGVEFLAPIVLPDDSAAAGVDGNGAATEPFKFQCWFCEGTEEPHTMKQIFMHAMCLKALIATLRNNAGAAAN